MFDTDINVLQINLNLFCFVDRWPASGWDWVWRTKARPGDRSLAWHRVLQLHVPHGTHRYQCLRGGELVLAGIPGYLLSWPGHLSRQVRINTEGIEICSGKNLLFSSNTHSHFQHVSLFLIISIMKDVVSWNLCVVGLQHSSSCHDGSVESVFFMTPVYLDDNHNNVRYNVFVMMCKLCGDTGRWSRVSTTPKQRSAPVLSSLWWTTSPSSMGRTTVSISQRLPVQYTLLTALFTSPAVSYDKKQ